MLYWWLTTRVSRVTWFLGYRGASPAAALQLPDTQNMILAKPLMAPAARQPLTNGSIAFGNRKRKRTPAPQPQTSSPPPPHSGSECRTRGATACDKCRSRKTRCDGVYPSCGFCVRTGVDCVYPESPQNACALASNQVLDAIRDLSALVQAKHSYCTSCSAPVDDGFAVSRPVSALTPHNQTHSSATGPTVLTLDSDQTGLYAKFAYSPSKPRGLETILSWKALSHLNPQRCFFAGQNPAPRQPSSTPALDIDKLRRLEAKYIDGVHSKNPALDLTVLHQLVLDVAENGLDWSTRTCLVCLVLAIGAITQHYQDQHLSPSNQLTPGAPQPTAATSPEIAGIQPDLALQFWEISVKRLGLAIGQHEVQAVQCLCLAGIWYMHQMEPVQAWQYFNLAASGWYAINLVENASSENTAASGHRGSFTTMQALYFTIWKSLCELRLEIDVPGVFDNLGLPSDFPLAPDSSEITPQSEAPGSEYIWYYYLAEIAARHQINRVVNTLHWSCGEPTSREVKNMLSVADALEGQISDWHTSLPWMFQFNAPEGFSITPHPDDMTQILRHRYLTCRELVGRCFLWLCLETPLAYDQHLRRQALVYASQCLRFCMLKLSQVAPHRHQGTWFGLRNAATSVLTLCAVKSAKRSTASFESNELLLPDNWHERATETVEVYEPLWSQPTGGVSEIGLLLRTALGAASPSCASEEA